jgi:demethylmenaquinone methyltransferase/2-methoxy-6-polyprenyl-1,4-benzoquinol methylase
VPTPTIPEHQLSTGSRPAGATTEQSAAENVQRMFDTLAPTYDRANHAISIGIDRYWWNSTARTFSSILARPDAVVLDLCCGTGDMTLALDKHRPKTSGTPSLTASSETLGTPSFPVSSERVGCLPIPATDVAPLLAVDFSHQMLSIGREKFAGKNILAIEADALHLPIPSNSVDLVTSAFGFRNLSNYAEGLAEIHRILRPSGQFGILECNQPEGITGAIYNLYFRRILPILGGLITGQPTAYNYLNTSVERFPRPPRMISLIREAGFTNPSWNSYTLGTVGLYRATKP